MLYASPVRLGNENSLVNVERFECVGQVFAPDEHFGFREEAKNDKRELDLVQQLTPKKLLS